MIQIYSFLTSALDGVGWSRPAPAAVCRRGGGPQGHGCREEEICHPTGFETLTVQPIASRCPDYAIVIVLEQKYETLRDTDRSENAVSGLFCM